MSSESPVSVLHTALDRDAVMRAIELTAQGVSASGTDDIFRGLVKHLAEALEVDHAYIGVLDPDDDDLIRVDAAYFYKRFEKQFTYRLSGTPCENVMGQEFRYYPENVYQMFPDPHLKELKSQGYAGIPLFDSAGKVLGVMAVINRNPLRNRALIESLLKIFSVRTAIELERRNAIAVTTQAENELSRSEHRMRTIVESSIDSILALDEHGHILEFNPAAEQCFGYRKADVLGKEVSRLIVPERYRQYYDQGMAEFRQSGSGAFLGNRVEIILMRSDGSEFPVEMAIDMAPGVDGQILIGYIRDISERREAENRRRQLEYQLQQAQKMEAIGQLTGGIAHDFNNILTAMTGYMTLARERLGNDGDPRLARYLDRAQRSGKRASDLVRQMLTFSRGQQGELCRVDPASLIREWAGLLESTLPASVEIHTDLGSGVAATCIDPVQLEQVLTNLCINSRDAMEGSGELTIGLREVDLGEQVCASCRQAVNGQFIEIAVSDSGSGIPLEIQQRIFEPFFSTKEVGQGSGMGLSMVHGIVHKHDGHLMLESPPGRGCTVRVLLRPMDASPSRKEPGEAAVSRETANLSGRVLLVDDQAAVAEFMLDLLESWGLAVTVFNNSVEAAEAFSSNSEQFDLAILDQTMPRMTGLELAQRILRLTPQLPIVLYTGYNPDIDEARVRERGVRALVRKPVDTARLHELIRDLLPNP